MRPTQQWALMFATAMVVLLMPSAAALKLDVSITSGEKQIHRFSVHVHAYLNRFFA
jgi:hypothetical protein